MSLAAPKPNVPALRFPEFSGEWEEKKLGAVGSVMMCKRIMKDETSSVGDVPFYKIGTFGKRPDAYISLSLFESYRDKYPFPGTGDILISAAGTIGRLVIYDGRPAYFQDSNIVWIANDERKVINPFLHYCYQNVRWTTEDTTIARLYNNNLRNISIIFPSHPEQQKIAAFLGAVDEKIGQLSRKQALLQGYKKGCMQQLFSQTLRFRDKNGQPFPDWQEKKLGEHCQITTGRLDANAMSDDGEYPFFTCAKEVYKINQYAFDTEALLVSGNGANVGYIHYYHGKFNAYQRTYVLDGFDFNIIFGKYFLDFNLRKRIFSEVKEGNTPYIVKGTLSDMPLTLPSHPDEQRKIADFLVAIDEKITLIAQELEAAKQFKKGLLQQMFV